MSHGSIVKFLNNVKSLINVGAYTIMNTKCLCLWEESFDAIIKLLYCDLEIKNSDHENKSFTK